MLNDIFFMFWCLMAQFSLTIGTWKNGLSSLPSLAAQWAFQANFGFLHLKMNE